MKKLGLIGGTGPESTIVYYRELTHGVRKKLGRPYFPHLAVESLSVFEVLDYCARSDFDGLTDYLARGVRSLAACGCDAAALTGITPHVVFERLAAASPIPLVSMMDTARDAARRLGFRRVALWGTAPTMRGSFFQNSFAAAGIEAVTPNAGEQALIGKKIETELEYGVVSAETRDRLADIAERMKRDDGIEAVVLGCTELPLLFETTPLPLPALDVMKLHIAALIDMIAADCA